MDSMTKALARSESEHYKSLPVTITDEFHSGSMRLGITKLTVGSEGG